MFIGKEKSRQLYLIRNPNEWSRYEYERIIPQDDKKIILKEFFVYENYFKEIPKQFKTKAQQILYVETRSGRVKRKPCKKCGKKETHGHHEDYSKPLKIVWLCDKHHKERHRELNTKKVIHRVVLDN